jgi:DivIVA domain-containing protein
MDVTPQLIEQIDFSEKWKGYDPDEVDDFLERVGSTLTTLLDNVRGVTERADRAQAQLAEANAAIDARPTAMSAQDDVEIEQASRTLVLAKRTAEAAISEARAEASGIVSEAKAKAETDVTVATQEAERLVREATAQRDDMMRKARDDAEAEFAEQREIFRSEVDDLEQKKLQLIEEVRQLEGRIGGYRTDIELVRDAMTGLLDDPDSLRVERPLDIEIGETGEGATRSPFYSTSSTPVVSIPEPEAEPAPGSVPEPEVELPEPASVPASVSTDTVELKAADGGVDPWGPGSWAQVSATLEDEDEGERPAATDSGEFMPDLEAAITVDESPVDQQIDAFLEADEPKGRRFGRRR